MHKKIITIALATTLASAMAACGAAPQSAPDKVSSTETRAESKVTAEANVNETSVTGESTAETQSVSQSEAVPEPDANAVSTSEASAISASSEAEPLDAYHQFAGKWVSDDDTGATISITPSGLENSFDIFAEEKDGDKTTVYTMQASFEADENLFYTNGTVASRETFEDGTNDVYQSTDNSGMIYYDNADKLLYWVEELDEEETQRLAQELQDDTMPENVKTFVKSEETEETAEPEMKEFRGEAKQIFRNTVFVGNDLETHMFLFNADTKFDFGKEGILGNDDDVLVKYTDKDGAYQVTEFTVTNHKKKLQYMSGTVNTVQDNAVTITNNSLSVTFRKDKDTSIQNGTLEKGAEVNIGYVGNLNESPYAASIAITKAAQPAEIYAVRGIISDITTQNILLSINSAHGYSFAYNNETTIIGAATQAGLGDEVIISYTGELGKDAVAKNINILTKYAGTRFIMPGNISKVTDDELTITNGADQYSFRLTSSTIVYGDEMMVPNRAVVTYTADANGNNTAEIVYCIARDEPTPEQKKEAEEAKREEAGETTPEEKQDEETVVPDENRSSSEEEIVPDKQEDSADPDGGSPQDGEQEAEEPSDDPDEAIHGSSDEITPEDEQEQQQDENIDVDPATVDEEEYLVEKNGYIDEWVEKDYCVVSFDDGNVERFDITEDLKIASGYLPKFDDYVTITYDFETQEMKEIELIERAPEIPDEEYDPNAETPTPTPTPEPEITETPTPTPTPEPEYTEPVQETPVYEEPAPQEQPTDVYTPEYTEPVVEQPQEAVLPDPVIVETPAETAEPIPSDSGLLDAVLQE